MSLWDIIVWPFARLLEFLYNWTDSYGISVILFALVVNLILWPFMAKSKKGTMKTTRIQPQLKELERKHKGNPQKYQQEVMKLYKEQGASPTAGCLWSLIPFPILIALYGVIRQPLKYMMGLKSAQIEKITAWCAENAGYVAPSRATYAEINIADLMHQHWDALINALGDFGGKLINLDYSFLGMNLGQVPQWKIWNYDFSAPDIGAQIGLFLIPLIAAFLSWLSMRISQMTNPPQATEQAAASMKTMNVVMPLTSIWICFLMPAALGVYWIANSCFGIIRDLVLTKYYTKKLDLEDAKRAEAKKDSEREAKHAEYEQLKAEGATSRNENTSKKKMQAQQKQADAERAAALERSEREAKRERLGVEKEQSPSQVGKRRYARGRAYDPNRYADEAKQAQKAPEENAKAPDEPSKEAEKEPEQSQEKE